MITLLSLLQITKTVLFWSCQKACDALVHLLDKIFVRFGTKLHREIVRIPMGTKHTPIIADLFLF